MPLTPCRSPLATHSLPLTPSASLPLPLPPIAPAPRLFLAPWLLDPPLPVLPNGALFSLPRMGKSACFAQRRAVFPGLAGQKPLFCPTERCFPCRGWAKVLVLPNEGEIIRVRDPKMAVFGVRRRVFLGPGTQNALFWGTEGRFPGFGNPKWLLLVYEDEFFRVRDPKMACFGVRKAGGEGERDDEAPGLRDNAAGIYEIRRLQRGHCGGLWGRPSSRPAVARAVPGAGRCPAGGTVNPHFRDRRGASPCAARHCSAVAASLFELRRFTSRVHRCAAP